MALLRSALALLACALAEAARWTAAPAAAPAPLLPDVARRIGAFLEPWLAYSPGVEAARMWPGGGELQGEERILRMDFLRGGALLLVVGAHGASAVWRLWPPERLAVLSGGHAWAPGQLRPRIAEARVLSDGERLVTLGSDGAVVWSTSSGRLLRRLPFQGLCEEQRSLRVLAGDGVVTGVSAFAGDPAIIWNASSGEAVLLPEAEGVTALEASPCGARVVTGCRTGFSLWDAAGRLQQVVLHPVGSPVAVSAAGAFVFTRSRDEIFVWEAREGTLGVLSVGSAIVDAVLVRGGDELLVFSAGGAVVWDIASGRELRALEEGAMEQSTGHTVSVTGDVVAACSSRVVAESGSYGDHAVEEGLEIEVSTKVWDAATGRLLHSRADAGLGTSSTWRCSVALRPMTLG